MKMVIALLNMYQKKIVAFYADKMRTFIPMSYSVGKYIANRMKSNMKFAYKCLDKLEGRI